jgi:hypothetical protein
MEPSGRNQWQPVATSDKWDALKNRSKRPIRNRRQPTATSPHGKEAVPSARIDGEETPSEVTVSLRVASLLLRFCCGL